MLIWGFFLRIRKTFPDVSLVFQGGRWGQEGDHMPVTQTSQATGKEITTMGNKISALRRTSVEMATAQATLSV